MRRDWEKTRGMPKKERMAVELAIAGWTSRDAAGRKGMKIWTDPAGVWVVGVYEAWFRMRQKHKVYVANV